MVAMLDGLLDSVEFDYVFEAVTVAVRRARWLLKEDRGTLSEWRRAEDCYLLQHGEIEHVECDWCNLGGERLNDHRDFMRSRAVMLKTKALEVMRRRKWDTHGKTETRRET